MFSHMVGLFCFFQLLASARGHEQGCVDGSATCHLSKDVKEIETSTLMQQPGAIRAVGALDVVISGVGGGGGSATPATGGCEDLENKLAEAEENLAEATKPQDLKVKCEEAEPQSPRDLSMNKESGDNKFPAGELPAMAATLNKKQAEQLKLVNVHYHLGAEHKSDDYSNDTKSIEYDNKDKATEHHSLLQSEVDHRSYSDDPRPGFMCKTDNLSPEESEPYKFEHCTGNHVLVGNTYEVHYVHSSAGCRDSNIEEKEDCPEGWKKCTKETCLDNGLGMAAAGRGQQNPMVVVKAQVFQIVNDNATMEVDKLQERAADMLHDAYVFDGDDSSWYAYPGSTTGTSHNNEICSPYAITWHVDLGCRKIHASTFDNMCKMMKQYKMDKETSPHGSREIVSPKYVCPAESVELLSDL